MKMSVTKTVNDANRKTAEANRTVNNANRTKQNADNTVKGVKRLFGKK